MNVAVSNIAKGSAYTLKNPDNGKSLKIESDGKFEPEIREAFRAMPGSIGGLIIEDFGNSWQKL